ncbi:MAG: hypothetical protein KGH93_00140 [Patescibacteria group bacterium]|nr:hypothetical protein [Patescibacteria group bacterium]MDE1945608.1 hypothetical protein [Patescibacteria group bacterium]
MKILFFQNKFFPKGKQGQKFDQDFSFHHERGVAIEGQDAFFASGINHGGEIHFVKIPDTNFTDLKDWVFKSFGDPEPVESDYQLGTFYKRIWRPMACGCRPWELNSQEKLNESFVSLHIILNKLENLFETIEPNKDNLSTYGHKIREILLLACMEVESAWTAVLKENAYPLPKGDFTTNDYVKLKEIMFLDVYELALQSYPDFPAFMPFKDWNVAKPTTSLSWYDAYNKTKHDREENLRFATLENAVYAVGAAVVMFHAQFGLNFGTGFMDQKSPIIRNIFKIVSINFEKYEKQFYISKLELDTTSGKPTFSPIKGYTVINYPF